MAITASAETLMTQAGQTAEVWMDMGRSYVDKWFPEYPVEAKAQLIAAYMTAAAGDEMAVYIAKVAEAVDNVQFGG